MTRRGWGPVARRVLRPSWRWLVPVVAVLALAAVVPALLRPPERADGTCDPPSSAAVAAWSGRAGGPAPGWVAGWGLALQPALPNHPSSEGFTDRTLRQSAHLSLGGPRLRVHLSNHDGDRPLVVGASTVARCADDGGAAVSGVPVPVTFGGRASTTVPVGGTVTSDPVDLPVRDGGNVLVSTWLPGPTGPTTWRPTAWTRSYVADGDATRSRGDGYELLGSSVFFLEGVDVDTPSVGTVVAFGDSITEGFGGPGVVDAHVAWPDVLGRRLAALPPDRRMGVVNAGISGDELLTDRGGPSMVGRFGRDVLERTDVHTVVVLGGVNDLIRSDGRVSPDAMLAGYRTIVAQARRAGVRVVGATILPFGGSSLHTDGGEATRQRVNDWIRTSGTFDAVADLDAVVRDPDDPTRLRTAYDSGDGLHPSPAGYAAMGAAIRLGDLGP